MGKYYEFVRTLLSVCNVYSIQQSVAWSIEKKKTHDRVCSEHSFVIESRSSQLNEEHRRSSEPLYSSRHHKMYQMMYSASLKCTSGSPQIIELLMLIHIRPLAIFSQ